MVEILLMDWFKSGLLYDGFLRSYSTMGFYAVLRSYVVLQVRLLILPTAIRCVPISTHFNASFLQGIGAQETGVCA